MANTKRTNMAISQKSKDLVVAQIQNLQKQLEQKLEQYKNQNGTDYSLTIIEEKPVDNYDYVRPSHYVQDDGRETWERMLDMWSKEEVALWMEMTVFKYQDRIGKKPNEDIEREQNKIDWYNDKAKELREEIAKENKSFF